MTSTLPPALRRFGWLLGLPLLGAIWAGATLVVAPVVAARVAAGAEAVAQATEAGSPEPWLRVSVEGRDLVARGEAPGPAARTAALARLSALDGARRVVSEVGLVETATPFTWSATRTGPERIALSGSRPAEIGRVMLRTRLAADFSGTAAIEDAARAAHGAPQDFPEAASYAVARLRSLLPGGTAGIADTVLAFSGEAVDVAAYDALRTALADPPQGYSIGRVDILPPKVPDFHTAITRASGSLVLSGDVASEAARAELVRLSAEIAEGAAVDDRMRTARGLAAGIEPDALAAFLTRIAGLMQAGAVAFDGATVSARGDAVDGQAVAEIEALMRAPPAGVSTGAVALGTPPLSPYRVAIRREGDTVSLSGHLPDAATRERLVAQIRPRFFRERILDRTRIADGAPPDLAAVLAVAVPALAGLAEGRITVADRTLSLTGDSLYRENAARLGRTLPAALPPAWTARVAVQDRTPAATRDAETCRGDLSALVAGAALRFPAGASAIPPGFYPVLDALAALAKTCPALRIAIAGHGDPRPAPDKAAAPKAETVADAAGAQGMAATRETPTNAPAKLTAPKAAEGPKPDGPAAKDSGRRAAKGAEKGADKAPAKPAVKPTDRKAAEAGKPPAKADAKAEPAAPEPDLARQRALALVEYLLQAGAGLDQVSAAETPAERAVAVTLLP